MSDIFVSYASEDREQAKRIAATLEQRGWSVWWDRSIPIGTTFDEVIERALDETRCVVVLWSRASVTSRWVKTEAAEGARRGILIPILIDDIVPPLEFRRIQAADLKDWSGAGDHSGFAQFLGAMGELLAGGDSSHDVPAGSAIGTTSPPFTRPTTRRSVGDAIVAVAAAAALGIVAARLAGGGAVLAAIAGGVSWMVACAIAPVWRGKPTLAMTVGLLTTTLWATIFGLARGGMAGAGEGFVLGGIAGPLAGAFVDRWWTTRMIL